MVKGSSISVWNRQRVLRNPSDLNLFRYAAASVGFKRRDPTCPFSLQARSECLGPQFGRRGNNITGIRSARNGVVGNLATTWTASKGNQLRTKIRSLAVRRRANRTSGRRTYQSSSQIPSGEGVDRGSDYGRDDFSEFLGRGDRVASMLPAGRLSDQIINAAGVTPKSA